MVQRPNTPAIQIKKVFEAQWSDCPVEVEEEVRQLWQNREYGNDYYYHKWDPDYDNEEYPLIAAYLNEQGANEEGILIHWWW